MILGVICQAFKAFGRDIINSATHISEYLKQNPSFNIVNIIVTSNGKGIGLVDCCIPYIYQQ